MGSSTNPSSYALALFSSLWAYDGWDQGVFLSISMIVCYLIISSVNYVAGEMKNPGKTIPKVINFSMVAVTVRFPCPKRRTVAYESADTFPTR